MTDNTKLIISVTEHNHVVLQNIDTKEYFHPYIPNFKCDHIKYSEEFSIDMCSKNLYSSYQSMIAIATQIGISSVICFFQSNTTCFALITILATLTSSTIFHKEDHQLPSLEHFLKFHHHITDSLNASQQPTNPNAHQSGQCPKIDDIYMFEDCKLEASD